ncbi:hypothetical protein N474_21280 [Pseudoalteromonas luteoviolacea CPMOR-2]|uniref:Uncharacterized protein n=2 Tax=Pseudoalteromonas luteoviolacea TaxID=43657 RepID=A0A166U943_9GAMM|nr:hypothetical protein [Pseudoalteromonas luteoviolacea]KZN29686.1 hypothetical protein N475_05155 [Pseudoalteromonas luteoviolacea DSM 6061]KZN53245.1 hypothetical protein N474_21280 [Pseudoalteromonas luteoviolacea CPMOR-2]MBE0389424.1 hypothetical protein [Pseudoalteromonas luteoviolacea DSM 6061]
MKNIPMTQETKDAAQQTRTYNLVLQDEVRPAVNLSNSVGAGVAGGLVGALVTSAIDSSINEDRAIGAFGVAAPLLNSTLDLNFRKLIVEEFNPVLISELNAKDTKESAETKFLNDKKVKAQISTLKEGEAALYLFTHYQFFDNFKVVLFETNATLFVAKKGKVSVSKPDYRNSFTYISESVGNGGMDSIRLWNDNNADLYRTTVNTALTEIREMLQHDIKVAQEEACITGTRYTRFNALGEFRSVGKITEREGNRVQIRDNNGSLVNLADNLLIKELPKECKA